MIRSLAVAALVVIGGAATAGSPTTAAAACRTGSSASDELIGEAVSTQTDSSDGLKNVVVTIRDDNGNERNAIFWGLAADAGAPYAERYRGDVPEEGGRYQIVGTPVDGSHGAIGLDSCAGRVIILTAPSADTGSPDHRGWSPAAVYALMGSLLGVGAIAALFSIRRARRPVNDG